jgi:hypothetical protein
MYARVGITTDTKKDALVVPGECRDRSWRSTRRVHAAARDNTAAFRSVPAGLRTGGPGRDRRRHQGRRPRDYDGAGGLRDGDRIVLAGQGGGRGRRGQGGDGAQGGVQGRGGDAAASSQFGARSGQAAGEEQPRRGGNGQQFRSGGDGQFRRGGDGQFSRGDVSSVAAVRSSSW